MNNRLAFALIFATISAFSVRNYTATVQYEELSFSGYKSKRILGRDSEFKKKSDKELEKDRVIRIRNYSTTTTILGFMGGFGFGYLLLGLRRKSPESRGYK